MNTTIRHNFIFNGAPTSVYIQNDFPAAEEILAAFPAAGAEKILVICDQNTESFARLYPAFARVVLPAGEGEKNWASVEKILHAASGAGLGRDALFLGIGGGVITDMCAFAASIYMRSVRTAFIATTLLGMADAALGGKTGIDLFGVKNLAGTFYPAAAVWMPLSALTSLPAAQWKSGFAEIIKAAIIDEGAAGAANKEPNLGAFLRAAPAKTGLSAPTPRRRSAPAAGFPLLSLARLGTDAVSGSAAADAGLTGFHAFKPFFAGNGFSGLLENEEAGLNLQAIIAAAVLFKGRIVEADPQETGGERAKLNLGHTFGHALEAAAGLGSLTHGEAVAWGIGRACALGVELGMTPPERAAAICGLLHSLGYETAAPHPQLQNAAAFTGALHNDKKKQNGAMRFIIPARRGVGIKTLGAADIPLIQKLTGLTETDK